MKFALLLTSLLGRRFLTAADAVESLRTVSMIPSPISPVIEAPAGSQRVFELQDFAVFADGSNPDGFSLMITSLPSNGKLFVEESLVSDDDIISVPSNSPLKLTYVANEGFFNSDSAGRSRSADGQLIGSCASGKRMSFAGEAPVIDVKGICPESFTYRVLYNNALSEEGTAYIIVETLEETVSMIPSPISPVLEVAAGSQSVFELQDFGVFANGANPDGFSIVITSLPSNGKLLVEENVVADDDVISVPSGSPMKMTYVANDGFFNANSAGQSRNMAGQMLGSCAAERRMSFISSAPQFDVKGICPESFTYRVLYNNVLSAEGTAYIVVEGKSEKVAMVPSPISPFITMPEGSQRIFELQDFAVFADGSNPAGFSIVITSLPSNGQLFVEENAVMDDDIISVPSGSPMQLTYVANDGFFNANSAGGSENAAGGLIGSCAAERRMSFGDVPQLDLKGICPEGFTYRVLYDNAQSEKGAAYVVVESGEVEFEETATAERSSFEGSTIAILGALAAFVVGAVALVGYNLKTIEEKKPKVEILGNIAEV